MEFTEEQLRRYNRHMILKEIGLEGQKKLRDAKVLVIGAGGLGSPAIFYLAATGVGTIGILDFETVDISNLQRQILHATDDVDRPKVTSAQETLSALNPDVRVVTHNERLSRNNARAILQDYDVIADACDTYITRYLINDACVLLRKPMVHGSVLLFEGQVTVFDSIRGPCYRCQYPEPPPPDMMPDPRDVGVLGVLPGIIGTMQAVETIKLILGIGKPLVGRLLHFDSLTMRAREFKVGKDPACAVCGENPSITELPDYEKFRNPAGD